jgi:predicted nucleic acid-binding protein
MKLVLDASVAVAAARFGEPSHVSSRVRVSRVLGGDDQIIIPAIFPIEVAAALTRAGEAPSAVRAYVDASCSAALSVATVGARSARRLREVAIASRLRAADAVYVWLASREDLPLCTLDEEVVLRGAPFCSVMPP